MKLIKINTDHYIVVDDSKIEIGDWVHSMDGIHLWFGRVLKTEPLPKKIIRSTQPLEAPVAINGFENYAFISLSEVKELIGEVDVEQKYNATWLRKYESYESKEGIAFKTGYNQALEDNKEKKYTEEDLLDAWELGASVGLPLTRNKKETLFKALQPKSEWGVKFDENGKLKLA